MKIDLSECFGIVRELVDNFNGVKLVGFRDGSEGTECVRRNAPKKNCGNNQNEYWNEQIHFSIIIASIRGRGWRRSHGRGEGLEIRSLISSTLSHRSDRRTRFFHYNSYGHCNTARYNSQTFQICSPGYRRREGDVSRWGFRV